MMVWDLSTVCECKMRFFLLPSSSLNLALPRLSASTAGPLFLVWRRMNERVKLMGKITCNVKVKLKNFFTLKFDSTSFRFKHQYGIPSCVGALPLPPFHFGNILEHQNFISKNAIKLLFPFPPLVQQERLLLLPELWKCGSEPKIDRRNLSFSSEVNISGIEIEKWAHRENEKGRKKLSLNPLMLLLLCSVSFSLVPRPMMMEIKLHMNEPCCLGFFGMLFCEFSPCFHYETSPCQGERWGTFVIFNIYFFLFLFLLGLANQNLISFHLIPNQLFFSCLIFLISRELLGERSIFFSILRGKHQTAQRMAVKRLRVKNGGWEL